MIRTFIYITLLAVCVSKVWADTAEPLESLDSIFQTALEDSSANKSSVQVNPSFKPSPATSDRVKRKLAKLLAEFGNASEKELMQIMAPVDVLNLLEKPFAEKGYEVTDINTAISALFVSSYEIINDTTTTETQDKAVWRQINRAVTNTPGLASLSNDDKQELAESVYWILAILSSQYETAKNTKDAKALESVQQAVMSLMNQYKVDIRRFVITDRGMQPKA